MYKTTNEIRSIFLKYFSKKKHKILPSSKLIPKDDNSILFTNAGMNQFKNIILGKNKPKYNKIVTVQNCIRTGGKHNDLKKVGNTKNHHTFFEMLGNFSFGNYFKKKAIKIAWELLTSKKWFNLNKKKIWVTIYEKDIKSYLIWKNIIKISKKKIIIMKDIKNKPYTSENFWQMGNTGPCGPCTEIFYNYGKIKRNITNKNINKKKKIIEIWNIVFMEFNKDNKGNFKKLPNITVDTGMGLERITSVIQKVYSNYKIDSYIKIKNKIIKILKIKYKKKNKNFINIITDHIRSSILMISEKIHPSNIKQGYILRKIIRRAVISGRKIGIKKPFLYKLVKITLHNIKKINIYKKIKKKKIINILKKEEIKFNNTLKRGLKIIYKKIKNYKKKINGKIIFNLYDTYGFPPELTKEICNKKKIKFDKLGYIKEKKKNKKKQKKNKLIDYFSLNTKFKGYKNKHINLSKVKKIIIKKKKTNKIKKGEKGEIILDKTPFYGESGGQIGDNGLIYYKKNFFKIKNTKKNNNTIIHIGKMISGTIKINDILFSTININRRKKIQNNHTTTHLLNTSLKKILKKNIIQKGSFINDKYIRFDFLHNKKIPLYQLHKIEKIINQIISENIKIKKKKMKFKEAKKKGAISLINNIYKKKVRVIIIDNFSIELCKGTHTKYTGDIGTFKIISESGISSTTRRIIACTQNKAISYIQKQEINILKGLKLLKTDKNNFIKKIYKINNLIKKIKNKNKIYKKKIYKKKIEKIKKKFVKINNINLLINIIKYKNHKILRKMIDKLKNNNSIIILISKNKFKNRIIINVDKKITKIITAKKIIKKIFTIKKGKGGGKNEIAEGNFLKTKKIKKTIKNIKNWLILIIKKNN
ncbi:alanine--tRNA ligase [Buchnera aphidicola]|uniref:alanine--tRNA ligase n=1 Tax=Buchnera aphidicola TaxID=9 RepID=UPI0031B7FA76